MIYIPRLRFIYLAGPKTGSVSAIQYLLAFAEANALEMCIGAIG